MWFDQTVNTVELLKKYIGRSKIDQIPNSVSNNDIPVVRIYKAKHADSDQRNNAESAAVNAFTKAMNQGAIPEYKVISYNTDFVMNDPDKNGIAEFSDWCDANGYEEWAFEHTAAEMPAVELPESVTHD